MTSDKKWVNEKLSSPTQAEMPSSSTKNLQPSRWHTKEFYFYYVCFTIVVPYMFYVTYRLSKADNIHYAEYEHLLSEGWIPNRKVDNSDNQYATFRDNVPSLLALALGYLCCSHLFRYYSGSHLPAKRKDQPLHRIHFFFLSSLVIVTILHGTSALKILFIVSVSYAIGQCTGGSIWNPALTWIFNLGILFMNEWNDGYKFASLLGPSLAWLDEYNGIQPRWHILFNFCMLRLVSFNMDYYWQIKKPRIHYEKDDRIGAPVSDKDRITVPSFASDYNYVNFMAYVLYIPLYLCGPIITYNDFISQIRYPSAKITKRFVITYALRLAAVLLVMELTLHYLYVVAISKTKAWEGDTPLELSMIGYFNLVIIWMKLLIPWRFFRLWGLADGIYTEENMIRCMSNNFSAQRFWKSWHRTFNRWMIRYIFVPLGGSQYFMYNMWVIFTFVALWHDIELKLLAWGWLICLFLMPELIASRLFSYKRFGSKPYYRFVCGLGAVANILMMMIANLVGFCVGVDGMVDMLNRIFGTFEVSLAGIVFLGTVTVCLFIAVQIMFEIRETEKRRGDPKYKM
ncbi:MBOAT, membrane-bound O-acyltransferase family-domain-containing protein [Syncephalastrum racemosum]|uniref:MBOAT, membrane-bound O-acyltransferase family-domain-containing protein n=1 Tax=Syncephalastrum racemosum TaxID=13706 RepID=A0A1X2HMP6_SYNRA|nr:MBOAT, membrane-bound O-acyltransferase family-domain-containing protein [Syncephalastrum racemosum]